MNINQPTDRINVPGVCRIWTIPMSYVTLPAEVGAKVAIAQPIITTRTLGLLQGVYDTLSFSKKPVMDANGGHNALTVEGAFDMVHADTVNALEAMRNVRHLVVFKDNMGQIRFIVNALFSYGADSSTVRGSQSLYFNFSVLSEREHYFYTSTFYEAPDGTFSF